MQRIPGVLKLEPSELFESSSPLAQRLVGTPHSELPARARALIAELSDAEKVLTLNAHPRIGARPAVMSARSRAEQGRDAVPELDRLNGQYEARFGFRFVVFVNRRSNAEIAEVLRQRLERTRDDEMIAGLAAIVDIAEDRLEHQTP